jgi:hypothetical protein
MAVPAPDNRSAARRALDEKIAAEPPLPIPKLPAGTVLSPVEAPLERTRRPVAIAGVIENGMVRLLDPAVKLPERSRVIVVASEAG